MSVEGLDTRQAEILKKFRAKVSDVLKPEHDDYYLVKWLRARNFDATKAEQMLRKHQEWRKKFGIDTILEDFEVPEVIKKYWPGGQFGFDKHGHAIWIDMSGVIDIKGISYSAKRRDILKYCFYEIETCLRRGREHGKKIGKRIDMAVDICDLEGFTWSKIWAHGMDVFPKIMAMCEANYPETVFRIYVINAPSIFPIIFNICKPFLSEDTKRKIVMLGSDWKDRLLEHIDADQLPQHWGGTCVDPDGDPYCKSKIKLGVTVPKSYYLTETMQMDAEKSTKTTLGPGQSHSIEFKVTKPASVIRWQFKTKARDVKFGIYCKQIPGTDGNEELVPLSRYNCHVIPEEGEVACPGVGIYEAKFDNSYSWMYTKELTHQVELVEEEYDIDLDINPPGACGTDVVNTF